MFVTKLVSSKRQQIEVEYQIYLCVTTGCALFTECLRVEAVGKAFGIEPLGKFLTAKVSLSSAIYRAVGKEKASVTAPAPLTESLSSVIPGSTLKRINNFFPKILC